MVENIIELAPRKEGFLRYFLEITYIDGSLEQIACTFFGSAADNPEFMLFSDADPEDNSDIAEIPDLMVNSKQVRSLRTIRVERIER